MNQKMKSKKISIIILAIGCVFLVYKCIRAARFPPDTLTNSQYYYNIKFDKEDSLLFKKIALGKLEYRFLKKSTYRNDIKCFDYNNQGTLVITKIDLLKNIPIDSLLQCTKALTSVTTMHTYADLDGKGFEFSIIEEKVNKINNVIFSYTGKDDQLQKHVFNKNFVSYYLPVYTLSLKYGEGAPTDIFFGGKEIMFGRKAYPLMISFYKRYNALYVIMLFPLKNEMNFNGDLLGTIMNDNSKD